MSLRVYNTLTRQKELFEPVTPGKVGIYLCGPTVYKPPHMGHMVGPVVFDAIKRYLTYKGFAVTWVVNITDVDDKLILEAQKNNTTVAAVAEQQTKLYMDCLALMGIDTIDHFPKASAHIPDILAMTQKLIDLGFAYPTDANVWFDVSKDADYGKLSNRRREESEAGTRDLESTGKRNPADFALWKAAKPGEVSWDSPWGPGRPGWHIECSAMSFKLLGETFDIHGGGMDLMFPHHENELAQSECCSGKPFVKYWLHNGLTRIATKAAGGEWKQVKMSKTDGNVIDPFELIAKNGADFVRYLILSTHYRSPLDFSDDTLASTKKGLATFYRLFERVERLTGTYLPDKAGVDMDAASRELLDVPALGEFVRAILSFKMKWLELMDDDFNTAAAIAVFHEMTSAVNAFIESAGVEKSRNPEQMTAVTAAAQTVKNLGQVLGLFRTRPERATSEDNTLADGLMKLLIDLRNEARKTKNFPTADAIRKGLTALGVTLEDRADGTTWRKD